MTARINFEAAGDRAAAKARAAMEARKASAKPADEPEPNVDAETQRMKEFEQVKLDVQAALARHNSAAEAQDRVAWMSAKQELENLLLPKLRGYSDIKDEMIFEKTVADSILANNKHFGRRPATGTRGAGSDGETPEQAEARKFVEVKSVFEAALNDMEQHAQAGDMSEAELKVLWESKISSNKQVFEEFHRYRDHHQHTDFTQEVDRRWSGIWGAYNTLRKRQFAVATRKMESFIVKAEEAAARGEDPYQVSLEPANQAIQTEFESFVDLGDQHAQGSIFKERFEQARELFRNKLSATRTPDQIKADFEAAEKEYQRAKTEHEKAKGVMSYFGKGKEAKGKAAEEAEKMKEAYEKARAEYVGASAQRFVEVRLREVDERLKQRQEARGHLQGAYDWYKGLSQYNLHAGLEKMTGKKIENKAVKFIGKMANVRTAASFGLLGASVWLGAGSAVGLGALATRRLLSGIGSGVGSYDLMNMARIGAIRKSIKFERKIIDINTLQEHLAALEAKAIYDGKKPEDLKNDELYQDLLKRYESKLKTSSDSLADRLKAVDETLEKKLSGEKLARRGTAAMAITIGTFVGSGMLAKAFGKMTQLREAVPPPPPSAPEVPYTDLLPKAPDEFPPALKVSPNIDFSKLPGAMNADQLSQPPPVEGGIGAGNIPGPIIDRIRPLDLSKIPGSIDRLAEPPPAPGSAAQSAAETSKVLRGKFEASFKPDAKAGNLTDFKASFKPDVKAPESIVGKPRVSFAEQPQSTVAASQAAKSIELRAGATVDIKGAEAIIHAGERGIEGAMLDLKAGQPEVYDRMIAKLQEQYPDVKGNGNLVHKAMGEYAKANGYTIDGGGKDLSWISKMSVKINADGSLEISEKPEFLPESTNPFVDRAPAAPETAASEVPTSDEYVPDADHASYVTPETPAGTLDQGPFEPLARPPSVVDTDLDRPASELATERDYSADYDSDATTPEAAASDPGHEARMNYITEHPKLSPKDVLHLALDNNETTYKAFVGETLGLKDRHLGVLNKMTWGDFAKRYGSDYRFSARFEKLAKLVEKLSGPGNRFADDVPMKKILVSLWEGFKRGLR